jgi:DNA modification methylase
MLKVYKECFRVLKPGKLMVVVTKDINRNYLTVPIGADTIKTVQKAGFEVFDIVINKMYFPSFWMVHYYVKQQENGIMRALTTHEYVLVFKKT